MRGHYCTFTRMVRNVSQILTPSLLILILDLNPTLGEMHQPDLDALLILWKSSTELLELEQHPPHGWPWRVFGPLLSPL